MAPEARKSSTFASDGSRICPGRGLPSASVIRSRSKSSSCPPPVRGARMTSGSRGAGAGVSAGRVRACGTASVMVPGTVVGAAGATGGAAGTTGAVCPPSTGAGTVGAFCPAVTGAGRPWSGCCPVAGTAWSGSWAKRTTGSGDVPS